jgi:hypothetical protein
LLGPPLDFFNIPGAKDKASIPVRDLSFQYCNGRGSADLPGERLGLKAAGMLLPPPFELFVLCIYEGAVKHRVIVR